MMGSKLGRNRLEEMRMVRSGWSDSECIWAFIISPLSTEILWCLGEPHQQESMRISIASASWINEQI